MAKKGLRAWVKEIGSILQTSDPMVHKKSVEENGGEKRKNYPKCVPIAKARRMTKGQRRVP